MSPRTQTCCFVYNRHKKIVQIKKKNLKINKSKQTYQNLKEKKNLRCGGGVCVEPIHKIELTLYNIECVFYLQTTPTNNKKNNQDKKKIMFVFLSRR
jgi:hypothetical protein